MENKAIGGYFELELAKRKEYHHSAIKLNTGRNAFEYILKSKKYKKVYLPYFTCDVILEPINKNDIEFEFYQIDENLNPIFDFSNLNSDEVLIYNNYFGICDSKVKKLSLRCDNLIIDNSQAFYSQPLPNVDTFYSPRKFFGISDGAYLYTDKKLNIKLEKDYSYTRMEHLVGRIDKDAEYFFNTFKKNNASLIGQPIKEMSILTQKILKSIDYKSIARKRIKNFEFFHSFLKDLNLLNIELGNNDIPMVYPFYIKNGSAVKRELIKNKIFIATYWPNVMN